MRIVSFTLTLWLVLTCTYIYTFAHRRGFELGVEITLYHTNKILKEEKLRPYFKYEDNTIRYIIPTKKRGYHLWKKLGSPTIQDARSSSTTSSTLSSIGGLGVRSLSSKETIRSGL